MNHWISLLTISFIFVGSEHLWALPAPPTSSPLESKLLSWQVLEDVDWQDQRQSRLLFDAISLLDAAEFDSSEIDFQKKRIEMLFLALNSSVPGISELSALTLKRLMTESSNQSSPQTTSIQSAIEIQETLLSPSLLDWNLRNRRILSQESNPLVTWFEGLSALKPLNDEIAKRRLQLIFKALTSRFSSVQTLAYRTLCQMVTTLELSETQQYDLLIEAEKIDWSANQPLLFQMLMSLLSLQPKTDLTLSLKVRIIFQAFQSNSLGLKNLAAQGLQRLIQKEFNPVMQSAFLINSKGIRWFLNSSRMTLPYELDPLLTILETLNTMAINDPQLERQRQDLLRNAEFSNHPTIQKKATEVMTLHRKPPSSLK